MMDPSATRRHRTIILAGFSSVLVRKILSPQMTGEEWPEPGRLAFQLKSLSDQAEGTFLALLSPVPLGPRNRVQSSARAAKWRARNKMQDKRIIMVVEIANKVVIAALFDKGVIRR